MVYVFLADGFEIIEAMAPVDMLRRANVEVTTVGVDKKVITSSCGIPVTADIVSNEFEFKDVEAVVIPGGANGVTNLENSSLVQSVLDEAVQCGALICAICAGPSILGHKGLLKGKNAICFPGFEDSLEGANISKDYVVTDGDFITAKGAGVCIEFGLEIVRELVGDEAAETVRSTIQCM
ncbi:protein/nucleic acid deglycase 3 [Clostridiales bacterium]|nr:protein/nucleic acid deglycase 3 [Clostridiales bacterium]